TRKTCRAPRGNGVIQQKLRQYSQAITPFPTLRTRQEQMARERHSRDNGPIQKRKRPPYPFVLQHLANSSLRRAAALRSTQVVRPVLQQRPSLIQQQRLVVRRPHLVAFHVGKLPLNRIRPVSVLIGPGRKGCPPAMRRRATAQVHVTHCVGKPIGSGEALATPVWEQIAATARDALQIPQHGNGLSRQR